jgi:hypothetical protein
MYDIRNKSKSEGTSKIRNNLGLCLVVRRILSSCDELGKKRTPTVAFDEEVSKRIFGEGQVVRHRFQMEENHSLTLKDNLEAYKTM